MIVSATERGRRRRTIHQRRFERTLLCGSIVALPLALGGASPQVNSITAAILVAALGTILFKRGRKYDMGLGVVPYLLLAALATAVLQTVPVPQQILQFIAPGTYQTYLHQPLVSHAWAAVSADVPATDHDIVKLIAYVAASLLAIALFRDRRHARRLLIVVSAAGAIIVCIGFVQLLLEVHQPYGYFGQPATWLASTFINPNHLAAFLGLSSFVSLGLAWEERGGKFWSLLLSAALCGVGVLLTLSRGGIICFLLTLLLFTLLMVTVWVPSLKFVLRMQVVIAIMFVAAAAVAYSQLVHEMWTLNNPDAFAKTRLWRSVWPMLRDFPVLGVGRGAFAALFPRYVPDGLPGFTFSHLENEWLQTLLDFGPVVGAGLCAAATYAVWCVARQAKGEPRRIGVLSALVFIGLHNLGDFNLQMSAVALPVVILLTIFSEARVTQAFDPDNEMPSDSRQPGLRAVWAVLVSLLAVAMPSALTHTLTADTQNLEEQLRHNGALTESISVTQAAMALHPADYLLPLLLAQHMLTHDHAAQAALPWINTSMFLAPRNADAHELAGRALMLLHSPEQAVAEYRTACTLNPEHSLAIAQEVYRVTHDVRWVGKLADTSNVTTRVHVADYLLKLNAPQQALDALPPSAVGDTLAAVPVATQALMQLQRSDAAQELAHHAQQRWPQRAELYVLEADALLQANDTDRALGALRRGIEKSGNLDALVPHAVNLLLNRALFDEARELARQLLDRSGGATAAAHQLLGRIAARQDKPTQALQEFEFARDEAPGNLDVRLNIARLRENIGDYRGAMAELEDAKSHAEDMQPLDSALTRLRAKEKGRTDTLLQNHFLSEGLP